MQRIIRVRLLNEGRLVARALSLQVDCIYRQRNGAADFYKEELLPRTIPLKEVPQEDSKIRLDLLPGYPLFVEIAELRQPEILGQDTQAVSRVDAKPEIFIRIPYTARGEFYRIGRGKVVFPIIVYSESLRKATRHYVELFWTGDDVTQCADNNFSVKLVPESKVKEIVGEL